jgi:hypothetical protein
VNRSTVAPVIRLALVRAAIILLLTSLGCSSGNGNGDSDGGGNGCFGTVSGAVSGGFRCQPEITYDSVRNLGGVKLSTAYPPPRPLAAIYVDLFRPGMPTSGTWTDGDPGAQSIVEVVYGPPCMTWEEIVGTDAGVTGSYTMNLTINGVATNGVYQATGSITATCTAVTATGATGTVTLSASF